MIAEVAPCWKCGCKKPLFYANEGQWFALCPACGMEFGGLRSKDEIAAFWNHCAGTAQHGSTQKL